MTEEAPEEIPEIPAEPHPDDIFYVILDALGAHSTTLDKERPWEAYEDDYMAGEAGYRFIMERAAAACTAVLNTSLLANKIAAIFGENRDQRYILVVGDTEWLKTPGSDEETRLKDLDPDHADQLRNDLPKVVHG